MAAAGRRRVAAPGTGWRTAYADYFSLASTLQVRVCTREWVWVRVQGNAFRAQRHAPPALTQGVSRLLRKTLGVQLDPAPLTPLDAAAWDRKSAPPAELLLRFAVWDHRHPQQQRRRLGTLYLHLHGHAHEAPFTTLLHAGSRAGAVAAVVLMRLPLLGGCSSSSSLAPGSDPQELLLDDPQHLCVLMHELGHALHYLLTASGTEEEEERALPHYLASAAHWSLEWREVAALVVERWARDPRALALLGAHWRLGVALPAHEAPRAAELARAACLPLGWLDVWDGVRHALEDQLLNGGGGGSGKDDDEDDAPPTLASLVALEQQAVLGGSLYAYVLARLAAAAVWARVGLEQVRVGAGRRGDSDRARDG